MTETKERKQKRMMVAVPEHVEEAIRGAAQATGQHIGVVKGLAFAGLFDSIDVSKVLIQAQERKLEEMRKALDAIPGIAPKSESVI